MTKKAEAAEKAKELQQWNQEDSKVKKPVNEETDDEDDDISLFYTNGDLAKERKLDPSREEIETFMEQQKEMKESFN